MESQSLQYCYWGMGMFIHIKHPPFDSLSDPNGDFLFPLWISLHIYKIPIVPTYAKGESGMI